MQKNYSRSICVDSAVEIPKTKTESAQQQVHVLSFISTLLRENILIELYPNWIYEQNVILFCHHKLLEELLDSAHILATDTEKVGNEEEKCENVGFAMRCVH